VKTWLIIDGDYVAHRNFHALGKLQHAGELTGVVFGFLRDVVQFSERLGTPHIAFAFDNGVSKRKQFFSGYKAKRHERNEEEQAVRKELHRQLQTLQDEILPAIGYRNIFSANGYEADDVIASLCQRSLGDDKAIIISRDHDLFQLISNQVSMWDPHKKQSVTERSFRSLWCVAPSQWVNVKAIAGCSSDEIPGVKGVGDVTAIKYLKGGGTSVLRAKIDEHVQSDDMKRNLKLVTLPYKGTPTFHLVEDEFSADEWDKIADKLNMPSLKSLLPIDMRF
jgi:DNA polymerase I